MGGGGGTTAGKSEDQGMGRDWYEFLEFMGRQLFAETTPLRQDLIGQMEAALSGEVEGGMIPLISRAVESTRQAASRTEQATTDELARTGLSGTPFAEAILGQTRQQGEQAATQAETNIIAQLMSGIPAFVLGQGQAMTMPGQPGYGESSEFSMWGQGGAGGGGSK